MADNHDASQQNMDQITEMIELAEGLDSCNRHMNKAFKNSENPAFTEERRNDFLGYAWEHLEESVYILSRMREMPAKTLLTCINILEHDQSQIEFPRNDEERSMYEGIDIIKNQIYKIIEEAG